MPRYAYQRHVGAGNTVLVPRCPRASCRVRSWFWCKRCRLGVYLVTSLEKRKGGGKVNE